MVNNTALMSFPEPTPRMSKVYDLLNILEQDPDAARELDLEEPPPRPWDITTIDDPDLRYDVWIWLEAFVVWLNSQHGWYSTDHTPACWPRHPPLVREISILAETRRAAGQSTNAAALDEWHRYTLPAFLDRTHTARNSCENKHTDWPGRANWLRTLDTTTTEQRRRLFRTDCDHPEPDPRSGPGLRAL